MDGVQGNRTHKPCRARNSRIVKSEAAQRGRCGWRCSGVK